MLESAVNEDAITSSFLRIFHSATDVDLTIVGDSPGGIVPVNIDISLGSVS